MCDVIVVGAGVGGLSCAAFLAQAGLDVLVLEAQDHVGGACHTTEQAGFCLEDGAIWLSMAYICRRIFAELGVDFDALVPSTRMDVSTRCLLPDGETFQFTPNPEAVAAEIDRLSPEDVRRFHKFMAEMGRRSEFVASDLYNSPLTRRGLLSPALWRHTAFLLATYEAVIRRAFRDERVRLAFTRPTLYLGLPPSRCPAAFALAAYGEIVGGLFYPQGGMGRIPAALLKILTSYGGDVRTGTPVSEFVIENRQVVGVRLKDGETIPSRAVVSNVHVQPTYLRLVGREHLSARAARRLESLELSLSYFGVQLGLDYAAEGPANTPALPPFAEMDAFWETTAAGLPTRLYPNVALAPAGACPVNRLPKSRRLRKSAVAPPGRSVVSIYHAAPYDPGSSGWEAVKEEFAERLMSEAEANTGLALRGHVVTRRIRTPSDLEQDDQLPRGAIYGLAPTLRQSGPFRPANRSPWIKGLYLTGHTTHPGLGVASAMASGAMTARLALADW